MNPQEIIDSVERNTGTPKSEFLTRCRKRELVDARKLTAHFLRKHTNLTLQSVGDILLIGHDAVIYYLSGISNLLIQEPRLQRIYNAIEREILEEINQEQKYNLQIPFLTRPIFIHLMKKSIVYGNEKETIHNLNKLFLNNFIIN